MGELSYPNPGVTQLQHGRLMGGACGSGMFGHPSDQPVVYAPGSGTREIRVRASRRAIVEGYGWESDATEVVKSLAANSSGSLRVDLVVLRLDRSAWTVTVQVVQGTPGAGAPAPSFSTGSSGAWELPLAEVAVASGATTLAGSTVTNRAWYVGSDGQLRCTPTTRPPHEAARCAWEHPTGRYIVSSGEAWLYGVEDSGQIALPLASNWAASVNVLYRRNGWVFLAVSPQRTGGNLAATANVTLGTLPAGFRPPAVFEGAITKAGGGGRVTVNPNGVVAVAFYDGLATGNFANVQALTFPAA